MFTLFLDSMAAIDKGHKKLLLITSSGGAGHIQAAQARADKARSDHPDLKIIQKDILIDWMGKRCGKLFVHIWNLSQKNGSVRMLRFLSKNIPLADTLFWPRIFYKALSTMIREDIDLIVDTQPLGTSAMIKALKVARYFTGKELVIEKVITELPTEKVRHFFKPIKGLSHSDRAFLKLISPAPLLCCDQTPDAFWMENCGFKERQVCYENFPLRAAFEMYRSKLNVAIRRMKIEIKAKNCVEQSLISSAMSLGNLEKESHLGKIRITIEPTDRVATIILGSQPAEGATIEYVRRFIELVQKTGNQGLRYLLFVFCDHPSERGSGLLYRVHRTLHAAKDYPRHLNIIPMCFQDDDVIAALYYRSDATFTRSGGLTSMELMAVARGQIWIHSEVRGTFEQESLCEGMPIWERGNAYYLKKKKGARFITPETFSHSCIPFFMPDRSVPKGEIRSV